VSLVIIFDFYQKINFRKSIKSHALFLFKENTIIDMSSSVGPHHHIFTVKLTDFSRSLFLKLNITSLTQRFYSSHIYSAEFWSLSKLHLCILKEATPPKMGNIKTNYSLLKLTKKYCISIDFGSILRKGRLPIC